jgi:hypothetical protein
MKHICRYLQTLLRNPSFVSPILGMASRINTEGTGLANFGLGMLGAFGVTKASGRPPTRRACGSRMQGCGKAHAPWRLKARCVAGCTCPSPLIVTECTCPLPYLL